MWFYIVKYIIIFVSENYLYMSKNCSNYVKLSSLKIYVDLGHETKRFKI